MSAVSLKNRNAVKAELWSSIFSGFGTETISSVFMKQLATTCISNILYLREILPDDYFETKNFKGMTLKQLKSGHGHKIADKIQFWLEGAFEAIDKKYLKQLMLDIKDGESKMTLEIYTMTFSYQNGNEEMDVSLSRNNAQKKIFGCSAADTKLKTIKLLQMCQAVTQTYSDLPSQVTLSIRLSYYENTPENYQPKGYEAWEPKDPVFPGNTRSIEIGVTQTKHHSFKLVNKSCFNESFLKNMKSVERKNTLLEDQANRFNVYNDDKDKVKDKKGSQLNAEASELKLKKKPEIQMDSFEAERNKSLKENLNPLKYDIEKVRSGKDENAKTIRCPCKATDESETMFCCFICKCLVHTECFGVLQLEYNKRVRFYCNLCHRPEGKPKCHDKVMTNLKNSSDQQKLALLRRFLKFCYLPNIFQITLRKMAKIAGPNCPKSIIQIVLNKMLEIGVAVQQGKRKTFLIDKVQLSDKLFLYFYQLQYSEKESQESSKRKTCDDGDTSKNSTATLQITNKSLSQVSDVQSSIEIF